jgi:uncharacterized membrane protein
VLSAAAFDLLGIMFIAAGIAKLLRPAEFREVIRGYGALSRLPSGGVAVTVTAAELSIGAICFFPPTAQLGALAAMALLWTSATVVALSLAMGKIPHTCGCFGARERPTWRTAARASGLGGVAGLIAQQPPVAISGEAAVVLGVGLAAGACAVLATRSVVSTALRRT